MIRKTSRTMAFIPAVAAVVIGSTFAADQATGEAPSPDLRVMSFNVKQHNPDNPKIEASPNHWELRKNIVFEVIEKHAPDILALQEPYRHQLDDLLLALPAYEEVGVGRDGGAMGEFCSVLYLTERFRAEESGTFWLSDTPEIKSKTWGHFYHRICTWVRLTENDSGRSFYIFNTHLDHKSQSAREKSVRLIAGRIRDRKDKSSPYILTGDFNAGEDDPVITYLKGEHEEASPAPVADSFRLLHPDVKEAGTGSEFTGRIDGLKRDYVFVMPGTQVVGAGIIRSHKDGRYPSDHYPVTATLRLRHTSP